MSTPKPPSFPPPPDTTPPGTTPPGTTPPGTTPPDDIDRLWQNQETPKMDITLDQISNGARTFQRRVRFRNALEYGAGVLVLVALGPVVLRADETMVVRVGALMILLGGAVVLTHIRLRGHASIDTPATGTTTRAFLDWHRGELARQRDLLRRVPLWYVGPLVPGELVMMIGRTIKAGSVTPVLGGWAFCIAVTVYVLWANRRAARRLEAQIAALPAPDPR